MACVHQVQAGSEGHAWLGLELGLRQPEFQTDRPWLVPNVAIQCLDDLIIEWYNSFPSWNHISILVPLKVEIVTVRQHKSAPYHIITSVPLHSIIMANQQPTSFKSASTAMNGNLIFNCANIVSFIWKNTSLVTKVCLHTQLLKIRVSTNSCCFVISQHKSHSSGTRTPLEEVAVTF